jgi:hypothetical protein
MLAGLARAPRRCFARSMGVGAGTRRLRRRPGPRRPARPRLRSRRRPRPAGSDRLGRGDDFRRHVLVFHLGPGEDRGRRSSSRCRASRSPPGWCFANHRTHGGHVRSPPRKVNDLTDRYSVLRRAGGSGVGFRGAIRRSASVAPPRVDRYRGADGPIPPALLPSRALHGPQEAHAARRGVRPCRGRSRAVFRPATSPRGGQAVLGRNC